MIKIETETYILGERGFRFKVGHDVAFNYKGSCYIGVIESINESDDSFTCYNVLRNKKPFENTKFYIKDVEDLSLTYVD